MSMDMEEMFIAVKSKRRYGNAPRKICHRSPVSALLLRNGVGHGKVHCSSKDTFTSSPLHTTTGNQYNAWTSYHAPLSRFGLVDDMFMCASLPSNVSLSNVDYGSPWGGGAGRVD